MPWNEPPRQSATPRAQAHANALRHTLTVPEKRLWWHLRHRLPVAGSHFRRQVAVGPYIADFCCFAVRLIVEVDGAQHGFEAQAIYDRRRNAVLEAQGFRVLRFGNADVMHNIEIVLDTIAAALSGDRPPAHRALGTTPTPNPSPQGGGE